MPVKYRTQQIQEMLKELDSKTADDLEDECLDFKRWSKDENDNKKNVLKMAIGFANSEGGTVVFGVEDDKKGITAACTGCPDTVNPQELITRLYDSTDPPISPAVEWMVVNTGVRLLLMFVHPIPQEAWPCSSKDGAYWIRIGKSTRPLTGAALRRTLFQRANEIIQPENRAKIVAEAHVDSLAAKNSYEAESSERELTKFAETVMDYLIDQYLANSGENGNADMIERIRNVWAEMINTQVIAEQVLGRIASVSDSDNRLPAFIAASAAIAPEQALEPLGKILKEHSSPSVRAQVVRALSEIKDGRAAKLLHEQLTAEEDAGVLKELMDRIEVGADSIPGLCKQIKHPAWPIRERAARALGEAGADDEGVIHALSEATSDTQSEVILTAINGLKAIGGEAAESVLKKVLDDAERPLEIRGAALEALKELRAKQAA